MPGSRSIVYEDAGHFPHRNHPWRFASDLLNFIEDTSPAVVDEREVREVMQSR
jgi:hypothetical protein